MLHDLIPGHKHHICQAFTIATGDWRPEYPHVLLTILLDVHDGIIAGGGGVAGTDETELEE